MEAYIGALAGALHAVTGVDHLAVLLPCSVGHPASVAWMYGARWGLGHGIGASLFGLIAFQAKETILAAGAFSRFMELTVGLTLIVIGGSGLIQLAPGRALQTVLSRCRSRSCCNRSNDYSKREEEGGDLGENDDGEGDLEEENALRRKRRIGRSNSGSHLHRTLSLSTQGSMSESLAPSAVASPSSSSSSSSTPTASASSAATATLLTSSGAASQKEKEAMMQVSQGDDDEWAERHKEPVTPLMMVLTGIVHGMSGAGHLVGVIPALTLPTTWQVVLYLSAFCIGTLVSMATFTAMVGHVTMKMNSSVGPKAVATISRLSSALSVAIGVWFVIRWAVKFYLV